jgi:hemoglobin
MIDCSRIFYILFIFIKGAFYMTETLYARLGGYDAISAVATDLISRLRADEKLGRFWQNRGEDGIARELQLLTDYLCTSTGGPVYYKGRDMKLTHVGMGIDQEDWSAFLVHLGATLDKLSVPATERGEVLDFMDTLKADIVDA